MAKSALASDEERQVADLFYEDVRYDPNRAALAAHDDDPEPLDEFLQQRGTGLDQVQPLSLDPPNHIPELLSPVWTVPWVMWA